MTVDRQEPAVMTATTARTGTPTSPRPPPPFCRSGTSTPITAKATSCRASASTSTRARSSRCSAATAPARPRPCARSPGRHNPELRHGEIWLDHKPLHKMTAYQAARAGVGAGARRPAHHSRPDGRGKPAAGPDRAPDRLVAGAHLRAFPRLGERRKQEGVTLSGGEQQMLAIAPRAGPRHQAAAAGRTL